MRDDRCGNWLVRFDAEQLEFANFTAAVTYADSLALRRTLVKRISPDQQLIELSEDKRKMSYVDYFAPGGEA
ncbi:MAG TPA: hypothetical protein V6C89_08810 [Drouetiella sp.]|jgi:hypothetical protein